MLANLPKVTIVSSRVRTHHLSDPKFQALSSHTQPGEKSGSEEVSDWGGKKGLKQDLHSDSSM